MRWAQRVCEMAAIAAIGLALAATAASARCTTSLQQAALRRSILARLRCDARRAIHGPGVTCAAPDVPACADDTVDALSRLAFDLPDGVAPDTTTLRSQLHCQLAAGRAAVRFARQRVDELADGARAQLVSAGAFRAVIKSCTVSKATDSQGITRPRVGGACATLTAPASVDGVALARCLRAESERLLQDAVSGRLPPNVLVIMTDDQRADQMGPLSAVRRELGRFGTAFPQSVAPTSLCCPSRASFLTGQLARHHGVLGNTPPVGGAPVFDASQTIAVWMSQAGYATGLFGKYMNAYERLSPAIPPGWSEWQVFRDNAPLYYDYTLNENGTHVQHGSADADYSTDLLGARLAAFVESHADEPFFAVFAPFAPHEPATPAPRHVGRYAGIAPWRPPNYREADVSLKPDWVKFQKAIQSPNLVGQTDALRIRMLETLLAVDEAAADVFDRLERHGLTDNTLVLFTSDNGFHLLEHWWGFKNVAYEESIRVPLYLRYPLRVPAPSVAPQLAATIDLAPTILDAAGATTTTRIDGRSLLDALAGATDWRTDVLVEHWRDLATIGSQTVRGLRWKYIHTDSGSIQQELYDLDADPWELDNLAFDPAYADVLAAQQARLAVLLTD